MNLLSECVSARTQNTQSQQTSIASAVNGDGSHRNAGGHLNNRQQRVHALEVLQAHRNTNHGQSGDGSEHAGQVSGTARTGNNDANTAAVSLLAVLNHVLGHAVRRNDISLVGDAELVQNLGCGLHDRPVRI